MLARKPLIGTVAANILAHGTGGLNVDGCRIGSGETLVRPQGQPVNAMGERTPGSGRTEEPSGRWPANVLLDEHAAAELDAQSGESKSASGGYGGTDPGMWSGKRQALRGGHDDSGGASRFFFIAKPDRFERDAYVDLPAKSGGEATGRNDDTDGLNSPRAGAGRKGGARNFHPTVKPVALLRHLVRLITPPGGTVIDPFLGSGSTGIAALEEGFNFIGIELSPEYAAIARKRILNACPLFANEEAA